MTFLLNIADSKKATKKAIAIITINAKGFNESSNPIDNSFASENDNTKETIISSKHAIRYEMQTEIIEKLYTYFLESDLLIPMHRINAISFLIS